MLEIKRIATEALALLDDTGVTGFTMRALARRLNVTPMALYHHVKDKAALATLVVEVAMTEYPDSHAGSDWQEDMLAMARWMRHFSRAHPSVAELRRKYQVYTPAMLSMAERWGQLWRQSGLGTEQAVVAAGLSGVLILGFVSEESVMATLEAPKAFALPSLPGSVSITGGGTQFDAVYDLAIRSVITGLHAQLT